MRPRRQEERHLRQRIRQVLRPGGYLFLGGAETTLNLDDNFTRVDFDRGCCYRLAS